MKKLNKMPIAFHLYLFASFIILIISVIFMLSYVFISKTMIQTNIQYTSTVFEQLQENMEDKATLLENLLTSIAYNEAVFQYIVETDDSKKFDELTVMDNQSLNIAQIENNVQEVVIEGFNGVSYYSSGRTDNVYQALQKLPDSPNNYFEFNGEFSYTKNGRRSFLLSTTVKDIWNITKHYYTARATLVVDMRILGINKFSDDYDTRLFILDKDYNICLSNQLKIDQNTQKILSSIQSLQKIERKEFHTDGQSYIVNFNYLETMGVYALSITPKSNILQSITWIRNITIYLLLVALAFIILIFMAFHYLLVSPLKKFGLFMEHIKREDKDSLKKEVNLNGYKEIVEISYQFNNMINEINSLTDNLIKTNKRLYETELQRKQAELLYLKSQINPHFLFNTLEVILGMSYDEAAPKTAEMVKCLAKIFKYSVKGSDMVPLRDELNIIQSYIHIQQTRFSNLFDAHYEFDEAVLQQLIPKMVLQPLIENAINHGLVNKNKQGNIYVGASIDPEGFLCLWIKDDGVGMDEEQRSYLQSIIDKKTVRKSDSIGFENVIYRLQLIYNGNCRITLESQEGEGTEITVDIPLT